MPGDRLRLVDVTPDRVGRLPCCGITNPKHEGLRAKNRWLKTQVGLGLRARLLLTDDGRQVGYIETIPGEHAWRGVDAAGYLFIHCVWLHSRRYQLRGGASRLVKACVREARAAGMRGVAVVAREKPWLASSDLFVACGFEVVGTAPPDYLLLARKFRKRDPNPAFRGQAADPPASHRRGLTIVFAGQCPYAVKFAREIEEAARQEFGLTTRRVVLKTCHDAQQAPTPYAVFSLVLDGEVVADHQISRTRFRNIMRQVAERQREIAARKKAGRASSQHPR